MDCWYISEEIIKSSFLKFIQNMNFFMQVLLDHFLRFLPLSLFQSEVQSWAGYFILLITLKVIHRLAPKYLSELLTSKTKCNYNLRSTSEILLQQPRIKTLRMLGDWSFTVAAPALWNNLPNVIRSTTNINSFKKLLKTHLFKIVFNL